MKKKLIFMLFVVLGIATIFSSCKKDDDETKNEETNVLYGTKWQAEDWVYTTIFGGGKTYIVIDFSSKTECELYDTQNGNVVNDIGKYKYVVNDNDVTFTKDDGKQAIYTIEGREMVKKSGNNIYSDCTKFIKQ